MKQIRPYNSSSSTKFARNVKNELPPGLGAWGGLGFRNRGDPDGAKAAGPVTSI